MFISRYIKSAQNHHQYKQMNTLHITLRVVALFLWAFGSVFVCGHVCVALSADLSVAGGSRWNAVAADTACPACPRAYVRPGVKTAPLLAETITV